MEPQEGRLLLSSPEPKGHKHAFHPHKPDRRLALLASHRQRTHARSLPTIHLATLRRHHHPSRLFGCTKKQLAPGLRDQVWTTHRVEPITRRPGTAATATAAAAARRFTPHCSSSRPQRREPQATPSDGGPGMADGSAAASQIRGHYTLWPSRPKHRNRTRGTSPFSRCSKGPRPTLPRFAKRIFRCDQSRSPTQLGRRDSKTHRKIWRQNKCQH